MNYFEKKCVTFSARSHSQNINRNLDSHYEFSHNHHQSYLIMNKRVFCSKDDNDEFTNTGTTSLCNQCTLHSIKLSKVTNDDGIWMFVYVSSGRGNVREGSNRVGFLGDLRGNVRGRSVRLGFFSRRDLSGRELPGKELSVWGYCPGENCPGGVVRWRIYRSPENDMHSIIVLVKE